MHPHSVELHSIAYPYVYLVQKGKLYTVMYKVQANSLQEALHLFSLNSHLVTTVGSYAISR